jgi:predicted dehydrogenase
MAGPGKHSVRTGRLPRVGVIGAGNMGAHHVRTYARLGGACELAGLYDSDQAVAEQVAQRFATRAYARLDDLLADVDAVSICTPTAMHFEHARLALDAGLDMLIEKPVALELDQAEELARAVRDNAPERIVQVGHIEHFNPAVRELTKLLHDESIVALEIQRLSPYDGHIRDADVVQDLMLHDIHVLLELTGGRELSQINALGRCVRSQSSNDYAVATLAFDDGLIGTLIASRVTEEKIRRIGVTTEGSHVTVDYLRRTVERCRSTRLELDEGGSRTYRQESLLERVFVPIEEPLVAQLAAFLDCVRERSAPEVDLGTGIRCLSLVEMIRSTISSSHSVAA